LTHVVPSPEFVGCMTPQQAEFSDLDIILIGLTNKTRFSIRKKSNMPREL
jgi:hypothetical protein